MGRRSPPGAAAVRIPPFALLLTAGCDGLPTHPFRDDDTDGVDDPAWDTAWDTGPASGVEAWSFGGTYQVDTVAGTLAGETTMTDVVWASYQGTYEVGTVLCEMSWPATQDAASQPATPCPDCAFGLLVDHGGATGLAGEWCDAWYGPEWEDGSLISAYFAGFGFNPDYLAYGPVIMNYYGGYWTAIAYADWDGATLGWQQVFGYYYYY